MTTKLIQTQKQEQKLQQRLSQQQLQFVRMLEMPLTELEQKVNTELDDNPALETASMAGEPSETEGEYAYGDTNENETFEQQTEREERQDALEGALERIGSDDEMPYGQYSTMNGLPAANEGQYQNADYEEMVFGNIESFYDKLNNQVSELELTDTERAVLEYLIGSLDDNGYLRKDLDGIADELAIYHNIYVTEEDIENVLKMLWQFEPPGIGARSLQECLLLQIDRKVARQAKINIKLAILRKVISEHFDEFIKKHWNKIASSMHLSEIQVEELQEEVRKLNPKPGASLGESEGRNFRQITPDFIVDTDDDGNISFSLNRGNVPELYISPTFADMVETYKNNKENMSRKEKEALLYAKEKVDRAQGFIEAVKQRNNTLITTMKAIIDWQKKFFQEGDEADLRPMRLKDIAEKTGLKISTVSRVGNVKYAQTRWGIFPLRYFFSDSYVTEEGEEMSTRKIKLTLKEIIDNEDKAKPLSDEALTKVMKEKGFPIARRTVAKYREQLGLPVARLRK